MKTISKTEKGFITDCRCYGRGRCKACTKEYITWSEFVKFWSIITTLYMFGIEKTGLGANRVSIRTEEEGCQQ